MKKMLFVHDAICGFVLHQPKYLSASPYLNNSTLNEI